MFHFQLKILPLSTLTKGHVKMKSQKYIWLTDVLKRYGKMTFKEIQEKWLNSSLSEGQPLSRSTFNRHREAIYRDFGIEIKCDRSTMGYYLENDPNSTKDIMGNWLMGTLSIGNVLNDARNLHYRIYLEEMHQDKEMLQSVITAMGENHRLEIEYQSYTDQISTTREIQPYAIRLFNKRWYLLAKNKDKEFRLFSFDRIRSIKELKKKFTMDSNFNVQSFFYGAYGVFVDKDRQPVRVKLRAYGTEQFYLRDLPIHSSQEMTDKCDEYADFEGYVRLTDDFVSYLMSRSRKLEVLAPAELREMVTAALQKGMDRYKDNNQ